jgi:hypothetical protein
VGFQSTPLLVCCQSVSPGQAVAQIIACTCVYTNVCTCVYTNVCTCVYTNVFTRVYTQLQLSLLPCLLVSACKTVMAGVLYRACASSCAWSCHALRLSTDVAFMVGLHGVLFCLLGQAATVEPVALSPSVNTFGHVLWKHSMPSSIPAHAAAHVQFQGMTVACQRACCLPMGQGASTAHARMKSMQSIACLCELTCYLPMRLCAKHLAVGAFEPHVEACLLTLWHLLQCMLCLLPLLQHLSTVPSGNRPVCKVAAITASSSRPVCQAAAAVSTHRL